MYLVKIVLDGLVDYYSERFVALTFGFVGVDIVNMCNEVVFVVVCDNMIMVIFIYFEYVVDCVIVGLEKKLKVVNKTERRTVAYYEVGYVVVGWFLEYVEFLFKVFIVLCGFVVLGFV